MNVRPFAESYLILRRAKSNNHQTKKQMKELIFTIPLLALLLWAILYLWHSGNKAFKQIGRLSLKIEELTRDKHRLEGENVKAKIIRERMEVEMNSLRQFNERANAEIARLTGKRFDDCGYKFPEVESRKIVFPSGHSAEGPITTIEATEEETKKKFEEATGKASSNSNGLFKTDEWKGLISIIQEAEKVFSELEKLGLKGEAK